MEDFDYDIHHTTPTKALLHTIIKEKNMTSKKVGYLEQKLTKTGMPLSYGLLSDDDDIEKSLLVCLICHIT